MKSFVLLCMVLSVGTSSQAFSPVCPGEDFPKSVPGIVKVQRDSSGEEASYTVLLPETYKGEALRFARLLVFGANNSIVKVPLRADATRVRDWAHFLVAFIHTEGSSMPLAVEAEYGFPCTWVLTGDLVKP
jgi:hypothetical protein